VPCLAAKMTSMTLNKLASVACPCYLNRLWVLLASPCFELLRLECSIEQDLPLLHSTIHLEVFLLSFVNLDQVPRMNLSGHSMCLNPHQDTSHLLISKVFVALKVWEG
jgi:hypothetical protein